MRNASKQSAGSRHSVAAADLSHPILGGITTPIRTKKEAPEKSGAASLGGNWKELRGSREALAFLALEAEAGEIAVAQRNTGRRHQRAIDRSEQAGKEGGVGREADRSSLGHGSSLS